MAPQDELGSGKLWPLVAAGVFLLSVATGLAGFPGLHGDEAWFGLEALRIREQGLISFDGMHPYTGALYPWLLSWLFVVMPPGVLSLRLLGVVANAVALLLILEAVRRGFGGRRALAVYLLLCSSLLFVWLSRVAWEVLALQPFLLAVMLACAVHSERRGSWSWPVLAVFVGASQVGVTSHAIFFVVPGGFLLAAALQAASSGDERLHRSAWVATVTVLALIPIVALKLAIPPGISTPAKVTLAGIYLAWPLVAARAALSPPPLFRRLLQGSLRTPVKVIVALLVVGFLVRHGLALVGALGYIPMIKRMTSVDPGLVATIVGYSWALVLVLLAGRTAWHYLRQPPTAQDRMAGFLVSWAIGCVAVLPLLTGDQSLRHQLIPVIMLSIAVAVGWRHRPTLVRYLMVPAGAAFLVTTAVSWAALLTDTVRPPVTFRFGYKLEWSHHFLPLDAVFRRLEQQGICQVVGDYFLEEPLRFYLATNEMECRTSATHLVEYCPECPPTYVRLSPLLSIREDMASWNDPR